MVFDSLHDTGQSYQSSIQLRITQHGPVRCVGGRQRKTTRDARSQLMKVLQTAEKRSAEQQR